MFTNGYKIASMAVIDKLLLSGARVKVSVILGISALLMKIQVQIPYIKNTDIHSRLYGHENCTYF
jgi:hypothetical protein